MSVPMDVIANVYDRLDRMKKLAEEAACKPNCDPGTCSMRQETRCEEIGEHARWVRRQLSEYIGSGGEL